MSFATKLMQALALACTITTASAAEKPNTLIIWGDDVGSSKH